MTTMNLKVPDQLANRIAREAQRRKVSRSAIVRECVAQSLGREGGGGLSFHERARHTCGIGRKGLRDLSSNAAHLRGFGQ